MNIKYAIMHFNRQVQEKTYETLIDGLLFGKSTWMSRSIDTYFYRLPATAKVIKTVLITGFFFACTLMPFGGIAVTTISLIRIFKGIIELHQLKDDSEFRKNIGKFRRNIGKCLKIDHIITASAPWTVVGITELVSKKLLEEAIALSLFAPWLTWVFSPQTFDIFRDCNEMRKELSIFFFSKKVQQIPKGHRFIPNSN
ncbi:MAG: hypothetical protein QRY74_01660 [Chlamydia sp.]